MKGIIQGAADVLHQGDGVGSYYQTWYGPSFSQEAFLHSYSKNAHHAYLHIPLKCETDTCFSQPLNHLHRALVCLDTGTKAGSLTGVDFLD